MVLKQMLLLCLVMLLYTGCPVTPSVDPLDYVFTEDFQGYRGTVDTLNPDMFVTALLNDEELKQDASLFTGVHDIYHHHSFEAFGAFTNGEGDYSFGIREAGDNLDIRDSRLFLKYTNTSPLRIIGFKVSYDVEVWFWGARANRIRLKYHTGTSGFASLDDLASTDNPKKTGADPINQETLHDGSLAENRTEVTLTFSLSDIGYDPLYPGEKTYFRWQFSNAEDDTSGVRSGLGINTIRIEPIFE